MRDYDFMRKRGGDTLAGDPFTIASTRELDRTILYDSGLIDPKRRLEAAADEADPRLMMPTRTEQNALERLSSLVKRLGGAAVSVIALFAPVLIMIFVPSLAATLSVAFGSVVVLSVAMTVFSERSAYELQALAFAYAAVLIVFVALTVTPVVSGQ